MLKRILIVVAVLMVAGSAFAGGGKAEAHDKAARQEERRAEQCAMHTNGLSCGLEAFCRQYPDSIRCNARVVSPVVIMPESSVVR